MILKLTGRDGTVIRDNLTKIKYNPAAAHLTHGDGNKFTIGPEVYRAHIKRDENGIDPIVGFEQQIGEIKNYDCEVWPFSDDFIKDSLVMRMFVINTWSAKGYESFALIIGGDPKIPSDGAKAFIMNDKGETIEILRNYWF